MAKLTFFDYLDNKQKEEIIPQPKKIIEQKIEKKEIIKEDIKIDKEKSLLEHSKLLLTGIENMKRPTQLKEDAVMNISHINALL